MSTKRSSTKKNQNTASNTPSKANNNRVPDLVDDESPAPGSKEFVLLRNAQQGNIVSPLREFTSSNIGRKRSAEEATALFIICKVPALPNEASKDVSVVIFFVGDFYDYKEIIKESIKGEQELNGVTIYVPRDARSAKFISRTFLAEQLSLMDPETREFKKFITANIEQAWMIYAPYVVDLSQEVGSPAAVDACVDLEEYCRAWERALSGRPRHIPNVKIVDYYVGAEELRFLHTLYESKDRTFRRK